MYPWLQKIHTNVVKRPLAMLLIAVCIAQLVFVIAPAFSFVEEIVRVTTAASATTVEAQDKVPPHAGILRRTWVPPVFEDRCEQACGHDDNGSFCWNDCGPKYAGGGYFTESCDPGYYLTRYYLNLVNDANAIWWQCNSLE